MINRRSSSQARLSSGQARLSGGQAAVVSMLFLVLISVAITAGVASPLVREIKSSRDFYKARVSYYAAESGVEDAAYRVRENLNYLPSYQLSLNDALADITVSEAGNDREVSVVGDYFNSVRSVVSGLSLTNTKVQFFYGIQVGDGGLTMGNNAEVNGNVYSNGNVIGSNGATIKGDVIVAGGLDPTPNIEWTTQTADFYVGTAIGGPQITTVDTTNNVGDSSAVTIGSDDFARIAYLYDTGQDLKFARCTNADCSTKNITTVDSANNVGLYPGIALGADGFARISYFNDSSDDLKFARCTNADCTTKNITTVESTSNVGEYASIALGADDFARMSYYNSSSDDLKFARCTNADCTTKNITTVDATGNVGQYTSIALGADDFARMSYYDVTNHDLKFVRCTNADCTTKNITTVDSVGDVGMHSAITLGADGFARIGYFDETNDDLKFARCTNADCTTKNITTVDATGDSGRNTSLVLGTDDFARMSYVYTTNFDLKFVRCTNADCTTKTITDVDTTTTVEEISSVAMASDGLVRISYDDDGGDNLKFARCLDETCSAAKDQADAGQSFRPTVSSPLMRLDLYLKKVGTPADAVVRVIRDVGGYPGGSGGDVLATGTLATASVGTSYSWIPITVSANPTLTANTPYWVVIDSALSASNYFVWGLDSSGLYLNGTGEWSPNWTTGSGSWTSADGDFNFKIYLGGTNTRVEAMTIGSPSSGTGRANLFVDTTIHGSACPNQYCIVDNPVRAELPISDGVITDWQEEAAAGGTCVEPQCDAAGNFTLSNGASASLGPIKIPGNLTISNNTHVTITGTVWVVGDINLSNGCIIDLDPGYGSSSGILLASGRVSVSNNCTFDGSGDPGSYLLLLTDQTNHNGNVMEISNNASGVIYYAADGNLHFSNNARAKEAIGYGIVMDNNVVVEYESGLADVNFSSGPGAAFDIIDWEEF